MPASRGSTNRNAWPQFTRPYRFSLARYTMQVAAAMTETTDMRNRCTLVPTKKARTLSKHFTPVWYSHTAAVTVSKAAMYNKIATGSLTPPIDA